MAFHFTCPQGDLLEGDESQAGLQSVCPICGVSFVIPAPPGGADSQLAAQPEPASSSAYGPPEEAGPLPGGPWESTAAPEPFAGLPGGADPGRPGTWESEPELFHIPCPNGHELETPAEMLEQEALCPHCGVQFRLRRTKSVEYRLKREQEQERRERKLGKAWFNWAIVVVVLVVVGLVILIATSSQH